MVSRGKRVLGTVVASSALLAACAAQPSGQVILIVVDTLRADHLGTYGYALPTSPEIDRRAEGGAVFERAFSTSSWTLPAFGSIHTGRYPARHQAGSRSGGQARREGRGDEEFGARRRRFSRLAPDLPTLAETFAEHGFATGAIINNPFLHEGFGVARGFGTYDYDQERAADGVVRSALDWIDEQSDRFFLLVHFMDPHLPYNAPPTFRGRFTSDETRSVDYPIRRVHNIRARMDSFTEADRLFIVGAYDEEVAFLDHWIGRFFEGLEEREILEDALILLTSDHGEEFFDHGGFEHGHSLYDEVVRIPLVIWGPDVVAGRISEPVSLVDLAPTILGSVGLETSADFAGTSFADQLAGSSQGTERVLIAEGLLGRRNVRSVILWPNKVVFGAGTATQLFDLLTDPGETVNLADADAATWRTLVATAERMMLETPATAFDEIELDAELLEQLRNLGYLR